MEPIYNYVYVNVTIEGNPGGPYTWKFDSEYNGFNKDNGQVILQETGPTKIIYNLLGEDYSLIYANMDPGKCATREIHHMSVDLINNAITLTDVNSNGLTGKDPISIRLIARVKGDTSAPIISPDPEVINDPNNQLP